MITLLYEENKKLVQITEQDNILDKMGPNMWINAVKPTIEELKKIAEVTNINYDMLAIALDIEESAHLDIDDDNTLIVLDAPFLTTENEKDYFYSTVPFAIVYNSNYFVTISVEALNLVGLTMQKFKKIEPHKHVRLTLQILYRLASNFITSLKKIDGQTKEVERLLHNSMKNKELFDLMELNKSLVYFSTSLNANKVVLNRLTRLPEYQKYEDDFDLMEDVQIENNQAIEMCSIYRDILAGMMDAFASIISNNLNVVMKVLAIITIVLSIPTVIASFFGMNLKTLPFADNPQGFYIITGVSAIIALVGAIFLYVFTKNGRK